MKLPFILPAGFVFIGFLSLPLHANDVPEIALESFFLAETIPLQGDYDHVQGIVVEEGRVWVSCVDRTRRTAQIHVFELPSGRWLFGRAVEDGEHMHPGGIAMDGEDLWVPLATYQPHGHTWIEQRDRSTLDLKARFPVEDHIGCLAVCGEVLIGGNWDSEDFYTWDRQGNLINKRPNPLGTRYQDIQCVGDRLIASGLTENRGAIDIYLLDGFKPLQRIVGGKTDRDVCFMHEGMAMVHDRLYLLPEDGPDSRLFVFHWEKSKTN
ncbi:MAG: hypothetical protein C4527_04510 [Candidatus Omnitrophota bacterium]|jgi:hypothetical protein|nr:MAG: hypothetical protein C4527_04510 [Candidatus Omnitrophota bacterium]